MLNAFDASDAYNTSNVCDTSCSNITICKQNRIPESVIKTRDERIPPKKVCGIDEHKIYITLNNPNTKYSSTEREKKITK